MKLIVQWHYGGSITYSFLNFVKLNRGKNVKSQFPTTLHITHRTTIVKKCERSIILSRVHNKMRDIIRHTQWPYWKSSTMLQMFLVHHGESPQDTLADYTTTGFEPMCWEYSPTPIIRTSVIRNLDYPNAVSNVECVKKMVFSLKSQTLRLSIVLVFSCHTYMFNVGTQWYVIVHSVKYKGLQARLLYIFLWCNGMYIVRKVSFGLSELFRLSEQPIKPLCLKVFG